MIVWGGLPATGRGSNTGARFDPDTNSWTSMLASPLAGRVGHSAVWTGKRMIVWAGLTGASGGGSSAKHTQFEGTTIDDGSHYEPTTDTWPRMSTVGAPIDLVEHFALWTGTQMVVIGDSHSSKGLTIGGRYTPLSLFMKP